MPLHPSPGAVVTYLDDHADSGEELHRAVAAGPALDDPRTGETWVPLIRVDSVLTLVGAASVIDVSPSGGPPNCGPDPAEVIEGTQRALDVLSRGLAAPATADMTNARAVLDDFVSSIRPVQSTLDVLTDVDPSGTLAIVMLYLIGASAHLDDGDIGSTRTMIADAQLLLDGWSQERPDPA